MNCPRCGKEATDWFRNAWGACLIACPCVPDNTAVQVADRRERPRLERASTVWWADVLHYFRSVCPLFDGDEWIEYIPEAKR